MSADQRATLDKLQAASDQINALGEIGIIDRHFAAGFTMELPPMKPGVAIGISRRLSNER